MKYMLCSAYIKQVLHPVIQKVIIQPPWVTDHGEVRCEPCLSQHFMSLSRARIAVCKGQCCSLTCRKTSLSREVLTQLVLTGSLSKQQKAECAEDRTENEHLHPFRDAIPLKWSDQFELLWSLGCTLETEKCECVLLHPQFDNCQRPKLHPIVLDSEELIVSP